MKKTVEEQMRALITKHGYPPPDVVIPILEKAGRGEKELAAQLHEIDLSLLSGIMKILNLKEKNMRTVSKMIGVIFSSYGQRYEPIEL